MNMLELAQRLKSLRVERKLTLEDVASQAGLTRGWLSKVENFRVTPSLPALSSIAQVLGVTLSELFDGLDQRPTLIVVRRGEGHTVRRDEDVSLLRYESLAHARPDRRMDPFLVTVPRTDDRPKLGHAGEEFLHVLNGQIALEFEDEAHELGAGDCAYFDGERPHRVVCLSDSPAELLVVFHEDGRMQHHADMTT